jgi:hypothetical protein
VKVGLSLALVVALAADPAGAQPAITDGDTIKQDGVIYRLWGIDSPEAKQVCPDGWPAGSLASTRLQALPAGRSIVCQEKRPQVNQESVGANGSLHGRSQQSSEAGSGRCSRAALNLVFGHRELHSAPSNCHRPCDRQAVARSLRQLPVGFALATKTHAPDPFHSADWLQLSSEVLVRRWPRRAVANASSSEASYNGNLPSRRYRGPPPRTANLAKVFGASEIPYSWKRYLTARTP